MTRGHKIGVFIQAYWWRQKNIGCRAEKDQARVVLKNIEGLIVKPPY